MYVVLTCFNTVDGCDFFVGLISVRDTYGMDVLYTQMVCSVEVHVGQFGKVKLTFASRNSWWTKSYHK